MMTDRRSLQHEKRYQVDEVILVTCIPIYRHCTNELVESRVEMDRLLKFPS